MAMRTFDEKRAIIKSYELHAMRDRVGLSLSADETLQLCRWINEVFRELIGTQILMARVMERNEEYENRMKTAIEIMTRQCDSRESI